MVLQFKRQPKPETAVHSLHAAPAVPDPRTASVSQCQIFAVARGGISEVLVDLAPLTALVLNTTNLTATLPASMYLAIDRVVTDLEKRGITHSHSPLLILLSGW